MAITTFLSEKIRDPRVRGTSSSSTYTENFSVLFSASNQTGTYTHKLKYDPNPGASSSRPGSITVVIPRISFNKTFNMGTSTTQTKTANKVKVTVTFNGRRTLTINYEGQSGFNTDISDTVAISYQTQVSSYIEVMYMTGEAENLWSRTGTPTIYIHGKLADNNSVSSANIAANAITSAKINNNAVTSAKIANESITSEKIKFTFTNLTTPTGAPQRVKIAFAQGA